MLLSEGFVLFFNEMCIMWWGVESVVWSDDGNEIYWIIGCILKWFVLSDVC